VLHKNFLSVLLLFVNIYLVTLFYPLFSFFRLSACHPACLLLPLVLIALILSPLLQIVKLNFGHSYHLLLIGQWHGQHRKRCAIMRHTR
jgi:hypothetical protein